MQTLEPLLAQHPFFQNLAPQYLELIVGCAKNVRFDADDLIFREGEEANEFYIVRHGKVAIQTFVPGRGAATIETLGEGEVFGWSWLFPPYRWHFDARALELTRAIALDGVCLRTQCEADHDLGYELTKRFANVIMQRLQATRLQALDLYDARVKGLPETKR